MNEPDGTVLVVGGRPSGGMIHIRVSGRGAGIGSVVATGEVVVGCDSTTFVVDVDAGAGALVVEVVVDEVDVVVDVLEVGASVVVGWA